jgi:hypothetical protein
MQGNRETTVRKTAGAKEFDGPECELRRGHERCEAGGFAYIGSTTGALSVTVEVTFDDKSNGKLEAISALRVAERFSAEAVRLSPLCALP